MSTIEKKAKLIAFYLPQYHPIPENDKWWGAGFTEWVNVGKAKKLFKSHDQPKIPADLGYYDLRVPETREKQAELAKNAGIEAFCYWHYYFGNGKRLLEYPLEQMLKTKSPDFPFCLAWANHSWYDKTWKTNYDNKRERKLLIEQLYLGKEDFDLHFKTLLEAFKDPRYYKIQGKLVFVFNEVLEIKNINQLMERWQELSVEYSLPGFYFIAHSYKSAEIEELKKYDFNAINLTLHHAPFDNMDFWFNKVKRFIRSNIFKRPEVVDYSKAIKKLTSPIFTEETVFPTLIPNWDHTPRSSYNGRLLQNSTPKNFGRHVDDVLNLVKNKKPENKVIFIKSWNEWGEGNYLEPDIKYGLKPLEVLREKLFDI